MTDFPFPDVSGATSDEADRLIVCTPTGVEIIPLSRPSAGATEDAEDWESSEAYLRSDLSSASPTITIKERTIWVYHAATGGGNVTGTELKGSGGQYMMIQGNRSYDVEPGTYSHRVNGIIGGEGWIASGIRYK
jgi:hypothetical protein